MTKMFVTKNDSKFAFSWIHLQTYEISIQSNIFSSAKPYLSRGITHEIFRALQSIDNIFYLSFLIFIHRLSH